VGFFKFVGKALGKVAKLGLSVATKGLSDKVFSALKQTGQAKQAAKAAAANLVTQQQQAQAAKIATAAAPKATISKAVQVKEFFPASGTAPKKRKKRKATATAKAPKAKSGRVAPKGGLDLKKIGVMWRSEGKPGTWIEYVKAHKNIRKT